MGAVGFTNRNRILKGEGALYRLKLARSFSFLNMLINCGKCGAKCGAFTLKCGSLSCIFITRITSHSAEDMFFLVKRSRQ